MDYKLINNEDDIRTFMESFYYFHDSCLKELKYVSGGYLNPDGSMHPINSVRSTNMIFQSQRAEYSTIEIQFNYINKLNLEPRDETYDSIIYDASLKKIEDLFYWSDWGGFSLQDVKKMNGTWISAKEVKWRPIDHKLGESIYYS